MKSLLTLIAGLALTIAAHANSYTVNPSDRDLNDLDHHNPVLWGFNLNGVDADLMNGMVISKATISITRIRNWNDTTNELFINLVDNAYTGTSDLKFFGNESAPDSPYQLNNYFKNTTKYSLSGYNTGQAVTYLTSYKDTLQGNGTENFVYNFSASQIDVLNSYLDSVAGYQKYSNGTNNLTKPRWDLGLGLDADCHYYNDCVSFTVETSRVPDRGATVALLGSALLGLAAMRRRFARK